MLASGSFLLYSPIAWGLLRKRNADGMSTTTWLFQSFGFAFGCVYNLTRGNPLAAYGETLVFAVQSLFIFVFVCHLQRRTRSLMFLSALSGYAALLALAASGVLLRSPQVLASMQLCGNAVMMSALLPQLILNESTKSSGGWSPLTAALSTAGNAVRIFTTLQLTGDGILLAGYIVGLCLNFALLLQILVYGERRPAAASGEEAAQAPATQ